MDKPFPLKYNSSDAKISLNMADLLASGYEKDTIWMHIGMLFLLVVGMSDLAMQKYYLKQYKQLIISYQNFLEVFSQNSRPYSSLFYFSDDSMVWCANYLVLIKS
jgi:hypothetical protein